MQEKILVMGAAGTVGHYVLAMLRAFETHTVGASRSIDGKGAGWVRLDLLDPQTFDPALDGVTKVLLVSRPGDEEADTVAAPFIEAMLRHRIRHVVVLSALGAGLRPDFSLRRLELAVEDSGLPWTHVRPNFFMQMLATAPLADEIRSQDTLSLPLADARVAYVDAYDVAEVIVKALLDDGHVHQAYEVNGPEALDHGEVCAMLARVRNRAVSYRPLASDAARTLLRQRGFPQVHAERVLRFYELIRAGWCASPDRELAALLARPLSTFREFAIRHAGTWQCEPASIREEQVCA